MSFAMCPEDETFGPTVSSCRDDFDFTIKFERIFLSLIPSSVIVAVALSRVLYLVRRPVIIRNNLWRGLKLLSNVTHCVLQLALLISSVKLGNAKLLLVSSTAAGFVAALFVILVSFLEHSRSLRPSILLNVYLFFTILFDIVQTRTLWLASVTYNEVTFTRLFTTTVVAKALIILLESHEKSNWVQWEAKEHSPEETSGIFGLGAFVWLNQLFFAGYHKILTLGDLFPLDKSMVTENLQSKLIIQLDSLRFAGQKYGLAKVLAVVLRGPLLLPIGPRVALIGFRFCQPFLINTLLEYLKKPIASSSKNDGYGLIGATVLIYIGIALSTALYWYLHERTLCMSRGLLAGAVYKKTTEVKLTAVGDSAALTLMSTDVERIRLGFLNLHEFWANSIEAGLAAWLLQRQLGAAFVAPLVVVLVCIVCASFVNRLTGRRQKAWMEKIQRRVGLTANVISNMKHLKISGLKSPVERLIQAMRVDELKTASRFRLVYIIVITFGYTPMVLCPVVTFAFTTRPLDTTTIFTSVSYLLLLADPLGYIFLNTPDLLAAIACLDRIQTFLWKDSRVDFRKSEPQKQRVPPTNNSSEPQIEDASGSLIEISCGHFGWDPNHMILQNINLKVSRSRLTMVVGPVASGKSTLCKVLLGEIPESKGQITLNSGFSSGKVGYCDQTPYLSNTSIRENIIGFTDFNAEIYKEVMKATMLESDLSSLPLGDHTVIGSNGITLSGGQKQRVSMARALYLDSDFLIFDDILSGLDADTEEHVFRRVFGPEGLLRRRTATVVLCTHTVRHLPSADHIVALGVDGNIVEQGTLKDLTKNTGGKYVQSLGINGDTAGISSTPKLLKPEGPLGVRTDSPAVAEPAVFSYVDDKDRMMGDSTVYRHYLASLGRRSLVAFVVFGLGWGFFYNWGNIWLQYWSKDVSSARPSKPKAFYIGLYAVFQLSYLGSMFFVFLLCLTTMIQRSGSKLHREALVTLVHAPLRFFATTDTGIVTNLFSQDMNLIDHELPIAVTNLALDVCNALGMAAVIASSSPFLALTYPFLFAILYGIQKFYLRTSRQLRLLDLEAKSPLYTHFLDTIKDVATFRAFGWVREGVATNNRLLDTSQRPTYLLAMVQRWLGLALQLVVAILAIAVVSLATQLRSSTGLTGASLVTLMTFGDILNYIINWYTQIETSIGAVSRLKNFGEKVKSESLESEDVIPPIEWPLRGGIQIKGVSASYDEQKELSHDSAESSNASGEQPRNLALKDLNLVIRPGEKVAICGRSGSGKSSTILLLLRLLDPLPSCSQNIIIDDTPLHKIDRTTLRERIIAVPQEPVFLPDGSSFMSNLAPLNDSAESECRAVLQTVGLLQLVEQRGGPLASMSADTLSQGQKQLFSLSRAVLRRRTQARNQASQLNSSAEKNSGGILLLDEVSSSVDQETDRAMQKIIHEEFANYTIVMVSHRLEMVMDFDTVFVMDKGSIIETGNPRSLVAQDESYFKNLWSIKNKV